MSKPLTPPVDEFAMFSDSEQLRVRAASPPAGRGMVVLLRRRVEFRGASGVVYSFTRLEGDAALRPIGVTYAIADEAAEGWRLLRVGHTNNLADKSWAASLARVRRSSPAAELLIRLNVSRSIREAEVDDLASAIA